MTKPQTELSNCHQAAMIVVGDSFGEGTNHYECTKCGQPCDPYQAPQTEPKNAPKDVSRLARRSTEVDKPTIAQTEQKIDKLLSDYAYEVYCTKDLSDDEQDKEQTRLYKIYKAELQSILTASNRASREVFVPVSGYNGLYEVSNMGQVRSLPRPTTKGGILKQAKRYKEYLCVTLSADNKQEVINVHRLVAEHFLSNPDNKPTVNHKDGNTANNAVDNLEWATYSENERHSYDVLGKIIHNKGTAKYQTIKCLNCAENVTDRRWRKRKFCSKKCSATHKDRLTKLREQG